MTDSISTTSSTDRFRTTGVFRYPIIISTICILVLSVCIYFYVAPYAPGVISSINPPQLSYIPANVSTDTLNDLQLSQFSGDKVMKGNLLFIPEIGVQSQILSYPSLDILNSQEGVWHDLRGDSPGEGGNTILAGHRFQYFPPNTTTFYHLNKLTSGSKILIIWDNKELLYEVFSTTTVTPDEVDTLLPSSNTNEELTLYTCSPIGSNALRFVVKARLI